MYILYQEWLKKIKNLNLNLLYLRLCSVEKPLSLSLWLKFSHSFSSPVSIRGASNCHVFSSNHHLVSHAKPSLVRPFRWGNSKWVALYLTLVLHFCTHLLVRCKKQAVSHALGLRNICSVGLEWRLTSPWGILNQQCEWCETEIHFFTQVQVTKWFENPSLKIKWLLNIWNCWLSWLLLRFFVVASSVPKMAILDKKYLPFWCYTWQT